jgi:hypothetical protein
VTGLADQCNNCTLYTAVSSFENKCEIKYRRANVFRIPNAGKYYIGTSTVTHTRKKMRGKDGVKFHAF